ncbi:25986_t:CDS:2, partial [Dentiscutata erythropus]
DENFYLQPLEDLKEQSLSAQNIDFNTLLQSAKLLLQAIFANSIQENNDNT